MKQPFLTRIKSAARSIVDEVAGYVAPRQTYLRRHFQRMETDSSYRESVLLGMRLRGYRTARQGTQDTPWHSGGPSARAGRSPDGEVLWDLPILVNRSREINRDDPIGSGLTKTLVNNVIGREIRPQSKTGDKEKDDRLEAIWEERKHRMHLADRITQGEAQRIKYRKTLEDGGVIIKRTKRKPAEPVWFEIIEIDRVATPMNRKPVDEKGSIRHGVEKDQHGIPVAYWIARYHPGDVFYNTSMTRQPQEYERIAADEVVHLKRVERPGQTHGVPICHAILQDLRDLDLLMVASLKRVQVAACFSAFIKSPMKAEDIFDVTSKRYGYDLDESIEPGLIYHLYPDEDVSTLAPNFPTPELESFIIMIARRIGAAVGVSWQVVLKDFSQANYSSARTDLLEAWRLYDIERKWFVETLMSWEWRQVLEDARLAGDERMNGVDDADIDSVMWIGDGRQWVDPGTESDSTEKRLAMGLTTHAIEAAAQGYDWQELIDQQLEEELYQQERRKALGLPGPDGQPYPEDEELAPEEQPGQPDLSAAPPMEELLGLGGNGGTQEAAVPPESMPPVEDILGIERANGGHVNRISQWLTLLEREASTGTGGRFEEEKHPRDEGGKFSSGGGGGGGGAKPAEGAEAGAGAEAATGKKKGEKSTAKGSGKQLPAAVKARLKELKASPLPPDELPLDQIMINLEGDDIHDRAVMTWRDMTVEPGEKLGKLVHCYTKKFNDDNAVEKWETVDRLLPGVADTRTELNGRLATDIGSKKHAINTVLAILADTGLRPGNPGSADKNEHYGVTTITSDHVTISADGTTAHIEFIGKSGQLNTKDITEPSIVAAVAHYKESAPACEPMFGVNYGQVSRKKPEGWRLKDFRTVKATETAIDLANSHTGPPPPWTGKSGTDKKKMAELLTQFSTHVSRVLNNTPDMARKSYIHPRVFEAFAERVGYPHDRGQAGVKPWVAKGKE